MRGFDSIQFKTLSDFTQWKLLEAVRYGAADGTLYELPRYASSDLASTPMAVWGPPLFLPPCGWYGPAVYGHDCGYHDTLLIVNPDGTTRKAHLPKAACDTLCLEMLHWLKPNPTELEALQIGAIYHGVSLGGWHAFKEDRI